MKIYLVLGTLLLVLSTGLYYSEKNLILTKERLHAKEAEVLYILTRVEELNLLAETERNLREDLQNELQEIDYSVTGGNALMEDEDWLCAVLPIPDVVIDGMRIRVDTE